MTDTDYKGASLVRPLVLAIDLDETFAASDATARDALFSLLETHADDARLIYMSHGSAEHLIGIAAGEGLDECRFAVVHVPSRSDDRHLRPGCR